ncbi:MAG TPA: hypothetical protein VGL53_08110, partial [Bryobacteraceae bacterium]
VHSEVPQRVHREHTAVGIERNDVSEHAAEREYAVDLASASSRRAGMAAGVGPAGGASSIWDELPPVSAAAQASLVCTIRSRIWRRL